jgi:hypothetical protein
VATIRLEIVDAVAAALATATGLTVHRNLDFAVSAGALPALAVTSVEDAPDETNRIGASLSALAHECLLEVSILVAGSANPEAEADPYEAAVHAALYGATAFGGHNAVFSRVAAGWSFDLGDCAQRALRYRFAYASGMTDLEAST